MRSIFGSTSAPPRVQGCEDRRMDHDSHDWPIIPLDEETLALGKAIDERLKAEKSNATTSPSPPRPIELSFCCRRITVSSYLDACKIVHNFDQVLSLGTPNDFPAGLFPDHPSKLRLWFDDVTDAMPLGRVSGCLPHSHGGTARQCHSVDRSVVLQHGVVDSPQHGGFPCPGTALNYSETLGHCQPDGILLLTR